MSDDDKDDLSIVSIEELSAAYRQLLCAYAAEQRDFNRQLRRDVDAWLVRPWRKRTRISIFPENSPFRDAPDYFGASVVEVGGVATLRRLGHLDNAALAGLQKWNEINMRRNDRLAYTKQVLAAILTTLGIAGAILKIFGESIPKEIAVKWIAEYDLGGMIIFGLLFVAFLLIMEITFVRSRRERLTDFGELLAVAVTYKGKATADSVQGSDAIIFRK